MNKIRSALRIAKKRAGGGAVSDLYGETYKPDLGSDSEGDITTADMLARMKARDAGFPGALRDVARAIPHVEADDTSTASGIISRLGRTATEIPRSSLNTVANWLGRTPEIGPDTIAPLGLAPMGSLVGHSASLAKPSVADHARARYLEWKHPHEVSAPDTQWLATRDGTRNAAEPIASDPDAAVINNYARGVYRTHNDVLRHLEEARNLPPSPERDALLEQWRGMRGRTANLMNELDAPEFTPANQPGQRSDRLRLLAENNTASTPGLLLNSLPMDEASRLNRAREMGFDTSTPMYHGTNKEFDAFDAAKAGSVQYSDWGPGIYLTPSRSGADYYRVAAVKKADQAYNDAFKRHEELTRNVPVKNGAPQYSEESRVALKDFQRIGRELNDTKQGQTLETYLRLKNPYVLPYQSMPDPTLAKMAKERGHDGIHVLNPDGSINETVVFDPSNIRRTDAAFNPLDSDKAGLLLSDQSKASLPGTIVNSVDAAGPRDTAAAAALPERPLDSSTRQQAKAPGAEPSIKSSGGSVGHHMHNPKIARALRTARQYAEGGNVPLSDAGPVPGQEWPDTYDPQGGADFLGMLKDTGTGIASAIAPPIPGYNHPTLSEGAEALRAKVAGKSQGEVLREGLGEFAADAVPMVATSAFPLAGRALRAVGQGLARTPLTTGAAAAGLGMTALPGEAGESKGLSLPGLTPEQMTQYVEAERRIRTEKYRTGAERRSLEDTLRGLRELSNQTVLAERAAATQLKVRAGESEQDEYNRAVSRAERSRDTALARDRRFSDTAVGSAFDKAGGLAPGIAGVLTGGLSRLATGPSKVLYNYALPAVLGTLAGAGAANVPLAYNALVTEPDNPEKRAYEAYSRELPPSHPRKQEFGDYARGLPDANPIRKAASEEFYDPEKLTERLVMGGSEGLLGGEMGSAGVRIGGRAAKALAAAARGSGMRGDAARKLEGAAIDDVLPARSGTSGRPSQSNLPAAGPEGQVGSSQSLPALRNEGVASQSASVEPEIYILKPGRSGKTLHERGRFSSERAIRERLKKSKPPTDEDPPFAHGGIVRSALRIARKFGGRIGKSGGLLKSDVPGRTDHIETSVKSGSFVVPADTLSHLGESNTIAGARKLDQLLKSGPYGTSMGKSPSAGPKAQKALSMTKSKFASGGAVDVPILAAGGEYIVGPEQVAEIGGGDLDRGHAILDKFVLDVRNDHIATLQNLPGPQKD